VCKKIAVLNVRYFVHIASGGRVFRDEAGRNFSAVDDVLVHAAVVARELADDAGWEGFSVLVLDESGNQIARLPIGQGA
jgi:hypothetical protein